MNFKKFLFKTFRWLFFILLLFPLPFVLMVRVASFLYLEYSLNGQLACWLSAALISVLLLIYFFVFYYSILKSRFSWKAVKVKLFVSLLLVGIYSIHGIFYLSPLHFKGGSAVSEYQQLHPILRLSISTWVLIDDGVLLTDLARTPADYEAMGLQRKNYSLHFIQKDGYAHAFDLRTKGKSEIRNWLVQAYFEIAGLSTLRHTGTADHLHVSLRMR